MSPTQLGVFFCLAFVSIEAFQAVYLGAIFQNVDSFLIGAWVFGLTVVGCTLVTALRRPAEIAASIREWKIVLALNAICAVAWVAYFLAIQLIEPAVVFTIFSGMVPLSTVLAAYAGMPEAGAANRRLITYGYVGILAAILLLGAITALGHSGFVRGSAYVACAGVTLAALSGACTAFVILFSVHLNRRGVGPLAQFGLRFILYTIVAMSAYHAGWDSKGTAPQPKELAVIVLIGLAVIAFPLYLVQKAVPLIPAATIAAITALGPAMVFLLQFFDSRISYSAPTLLGLTVYMLSALLAVYGTTARSAVGRP